MPFPTPHTHTAAAAAYAARHGVAALEDQRAVAQALGLLHCVRGPGQQQTGVDDDKGRMAWVHPALAPCKDMEVVVHGYEGAGLDCPALHTALFRVLRGLIDRLGVQTWNLALYNVPLPGHPPPAGPVVARCVLVMLTVISRMAMW